MGRLVSGGIPAFLAVVMLVLLALPAFPARAGVTDLGETMHVEWRPDPLTLRPGETGIVQMDVRNDADHKVNISLQYRWVASPGGSDGNITPDFFGLLPGAVQEVHIRIRSHASFGQSEGFSDGHVLVRWERNLTRDGVGVDAHTWDGQDGIVLNVRDDFSRSTALCGVFAVIILVTVVVTVYMLRRGRSRPTGPARKPPQERDVP
jgi:hypothetical protein